MNEGKDKERGRGREREGERESTCDGERMDGEGVKAPSPRADGDVVVAWGYYHYISSLHRQHPAL